MVEAVSKPLIVEQALDVAAKAVTMDDSVKVSNIHPVPKSHVIQNIYSMRNVKNHGTRYGHGTPLFDEIRSSNHRAKSRLIQPDFFNEI
jgi:hypothetical protein